MAVVYGVVVLAFIPLFILFIVLLKRKYPGLYVSRKVNLIIGSIVFTLVLALRFALYILIQFSTITFLVESIRGEIPLYISEIFITLCYIKIMSRFYQKKIKQQTDSDENQTEDLGEDVEAVYLD